MSDPFDVLRDVPVAPVPDVAVIRSRARRIQRRRYVMLASSASVIAVIAAVGLFTFGPDRGKEQLAQGTPAATAAQNAETFGAARGNAGSASVGGASSQSASVPGADTAKTTTAGGPMSARVAPAPAQFLDVTLDVARRAPRGAAFTLKACNKNAQSVERSFNDAQRYDFEVSRNGKRVWRWSDGRMFSQITGSETWKPNECKTWTADWNGMNSSGGLAGSGSYKAVGILDSKPEQRTKPKDVCLDLC